MSSAHGAGLMLVPVLLGLPHTPQTPDLPGFGGDAAALVQDLMAVSLHTISMLIVMGVIALAVYEKLGVGLLRRAWLNVDLLWSVAVVAAGLATLFTS
jgi:cation transport ATPase